MTFLQKEVLEVLDVAQKTIPTQPDFPDLHKYGKTSGLLAAIEYGLPTPCTKSDITLVKTVPQYYAVADQYKGFGYHRIDYPTGVSSCPVVPGTNGFQDEIPALIEALQRQGNSGAVLLMKPRRGVQFGPRYESAGAFNIMFRIATNYLTDDMVSIAIVGAGFDGHEITQGLATHLSLTTTWDEVYNFGSLSDLTSNRDAIIVTTEAYARQRKERVAFLIECGYGGSIVENRIPHKCQLPNDDQIKELVEGVILKLFKQKPRLLSEGRMLFGAQGNFSPDGHPQVWEMFFPNRWGPLQQRK